MTTLNNVQAQKFKLSGSGVTSTDTSITVQSFKLPDASTNIVTADIGDIGYFTLEPGTSREESCSFTGVTQNADGTGTLTGVVRGLRFISPYDTVTVNKKAHAGGSILVLSNSSAFYGRIKTYVDSVAVSGAADGSTTVKGLFEEATTAEIDAGTATGGTGAELMVNPNKLSTSIYNTRLPTANEKAGLVGLSGTTPSATNLLIDSLALTGQLYDYTGTSAPTGWLLADGSAVSRTTYAALFAILSTRYGEGNGSTTFNLPRVLNFTADLEGVYYDNSQTQSANGTSHTYSYTTAGTNRLLVVSAYTAGGQTISGITYGGIAMTQVTSQVYDTNRTLYTYYLIAPTIGANNVIITASGVTDIYSTVFSFKNMLQSGVLDTNSKSAGTGASFTASITTAVANEILIVLGGFSSAVGMTGEADWTLSVNVGQTLTTMAIIASSASGAKSDIFTMGGSNNFGYIESAFKINTTTLATTYKIIKT